MNKKTMQKSLEKARDETNKKYGSDKAASLGSQKYRFNVVPSPSLMLDYKLGIGGFPYGHMVEIFGAASLGKSTVMGYGTLRNVQAEGKLPALIAMEPTFDPEWARKLHGLDPDLLLIQRPDNAEEAFDMLHDLVYGGIVDYILIDSIGSMAAKSETEEDAKKKAYGVSGVVTTGLNAVMPRLYKNNQGLMIINQQRQSGSFQGITTYDSPGGEALKHHASIRIQLKPGKTRYTAKIDDESVMVGRELICQFIKNKLAQAVNKRASFDFFNIETTEYGLGIDKITDAINVGKITGVIRSAGAWLYHDSFPDGKLNGKGALAEFLKENPATIKTIRDEVLERMVQNEIQAAKESEEKQKKASVEKENGDEGE